LFVSTDVSWAMSPSCSETWRILTTDHADFAPLRVGQRFTRAFTLIP
jgi:hypothetical protein